LKGKEEEKGEKKVGKFNYLEHSPFRNIVELFVLFALDRTTKVLDYTQIGMLSADYKSHSHTLTHSKHLLHTHSIHTQIYPKHIMDSALESKKPPRCIFVPD
jgi:hypothetical protein